MFPGHNEATTYWEDLRAPATGINPPGAAADPSVDQTLGGFLFSSTATNTIVLFLQLPHGWKEGSLLKPHVHWMKTSAAAGNVVWEMAYRWAPMGEVMDANWTALTASSPYTTDHNLANEHLVTLFPDVDATGKGLSDMLIVRLSRLGGDAADTYGTFAKLLEFDIHYQVDSPGSRQVSVKE